MSNLWELSQGPLYEGYGYDIKHVLFCGLAAIADMLMVLMLLFIFTVVYKGIYWIWYLNFWKVFFSIMVGCVGAIVVEEYNTGRGDWRYAESMPMIPWVNVGLSPVLQFSLLPALTFVVGRKIFNYKVLKR